MPAVASAFIGVLQKWDMVFDKTPLALVEMRKQLRAVLALLIAVATVSIFATSLVGISGAPDRMSVRAIHISEGTYDYPPSQSPSRRTTAFFEKQENGVLPWWCLLWLDT